MTDRVFPPLAAVSIAESGAWDSSGGWGSLEAWDPGALWGGFGKNYTNVDPKY